MFPKSRSVENLDLRAWSDEHATPVYGLSKTVQSQKDEANINTIVKNFGITGTLPQGVRVPTYGDFEGVEDYREAVDAVREAERAFEKMPADLRKRLDNDPQRFVEWCADRGNLQEMRALGLAVPEKSPEVSQGAGSGNGT